MTEAQQEAVTVRYIAGLGPTGEPGVMRFLVYAVGENADGERVAGPQQLTDAMTREQAEHLWMQLGRVLGKPLAFGADTVRRVLDEALADAPNDHIVTVVAANELVEHLVKALTEKELLHG